MPAIMPFQQIQPGLHLWTDSCNVYVLRDGDAALLIDLGDGSVIDHLKDIGVSRIEWVLFTHHHREQCQGAARLKDLGAKVGVPEGERAFFEQPASFRKMGPTLGDAFSVYGASFVRPPVEPVKVDHAFKRMDDFTWRGRELWCVDTRGNSPGSMSYLLRQPDGSFLAFSGDVMLDGARMHNYFDTEWDYGFAAGLYALFSAAALLHDFDPALLLPSHGPVVRDARAQLKTYQHKLRTLANLVLRGYHLKTFAAADQDPVSRPTAVPHVWRVTPHLYKFKGPDFWPNFTLLLADSGRALVVDCGLFEEPFLDKALDGMKQRLGLKQIDAVIVTHYHGDHMLEAPHLREKFGAKLWTMERVVARSTHPLRYDYAAPINTYGKAGVTSVKFDRVLADGETFEWEGYTLTADWMPGQTEFHLCLHGRIDGKLVAFTGDNLFASTTDPTQTGHEALVARNSGMLEEGYLYAANYLHGLGPDLIIGGHSWVLPEPRELIERYRTWALAARDALQAVSTHADYRYTFDPYWVRAEPYRISVKPGGKAEFLLRVRNFKADAQKHRIALHAPPGLGADPSLIEGELPGEATGVALVKLSAAKDVPEGVHVVAFDVTLDGTRYGEWFDVIVNVGDGAAPEPALLPSGKKADY